MFPKPTKKKKSKTTAAKKERDSRRQVESAEYTRLVKIRAKISPFCQVCKREGRRNRAQEHHHIKRRLRHKLCIFSLLSVCVSCHHKIESEGIWSKEQGYTRDPYDEEPSMAVLKED